MSKSRRGLWFVLAALVIVLDQASKLWFDRHFSYGEVRPVIAGFFNWTLAYNPGAAFSFLADAGGWQRHLFSALALVVAGWLGWAIWRGRQSALMNLAGSLIIGGALGNLIDRVVYGHVIDFIQLYYQQYYYPAFNVADSAIVVGAALMVWDGFKKDRA